MTDQEIQHNLDLSVTHLAARLGIAIVNLLLALSFSLSLFWASIYLVGSLTDSLAMDKTTLSLLIITLGSVAVVVFSTATAFLALRKRFWRLKYQMFVLAGGAATVVPWILNWTP